MEIQTEMNIDIAVKHLTWRLTPAEGKKIIPNAKDAEAFNLILKTLGDNYTTGVTQDVLFAKMLVNQLLMITMDGKRSMKQAIETVKDILGMSLESWSNEFQRQVPIIRLLSAFEQKYIKLPPITDKVKRGLKIREAKVRLIKENQAELKAEAAKPYTQQEFDAFIKRLVFELKTEFQDKP